MTVSTSPGSLTVASYWIEYLLDAALHQGCDLSGELIRLGISEEQLESPQARIPLRSEQSLLMTAIERTGDPLFGLHMGELIRPRFMGELGYASMSSANLRQAVELAIAFTRLTTEYADIDARWENDNLALIWNTPLRDTEASRHRVEAYFAGCITFGRWITGTDEAPREVRFSHPAPDDDSEYRRIFRCPVLFDQPENMLVVDERLLDLPLRDADPEVHRIMRTRVQQAMTQYRARGNLLDQVRSEIQQQLSQGVVQLEGVAAAMGIKPWTLRRRLRSEDADFTSLLDEERKTLAVDWLRNSKRPISQIAADLGYSEQSAFNRAFRRWFDCTPVAFREGKE